MYTVVINNIEMQIEAEAFSLEGGNIVFFADAAGTAIKTIVAKDRWDLFDLGDKHLVVKPKEEAPEPKAV